MSKNKYKDAEFLKEKAEMAVEDSKMIDDAKSDDVAAVVETADSVEKVDVALDSDVQTDNQISEDADRENSESVVDTDTVAVDTDAETKKQNKLKRAGKKHTNDLVKCVLVLFSIALVAGVLLGVMNWVTYVDPDQAMREQIAGYYSISADAIVNNGDRLVSESGSVSQVLAAYEVKDENGNLKSVVYQAEGGKAKGGKLQLLVHISADGIITEIEEFSQKETAGYFAKVEKALCAKYINVDVNTIDTFVLNGASGDISDIDALSGATLTSRGYNNAINGAVYAFKNFGGVR